jgi:hypothetical protein
VSDKIGNYAQKYFAIHYVRYIRKTEKDNSTSTERFGNVDDETPGLPPVVGRNEEWRTKMRNERDLVRFSI